MIDRPTPETEQWEAYCDECYYHMWRLRRKNERGWNDGFHIHTGEEAKGLCDLLNNLERERDEAIIKYTGQANEYEKQRNTALAQLEKARRGWREMHSNLERSRDEVEKLIRELDEAREQRDRLAEALRKVSTFGTVLKLPVKPCDLCARTLKQPTQND